MSRLRVNGFGISIDAYGAGPDQTLDNPMGVGGMALHQWVLGAKTFHKMAGDFDASLIANQVGRDGVDDDFATRGFDNVGAWIIGRNMFAPSRGPWVDDGWKGWWGNNPPYDVPVFVLMGADQPVGTLSSSSEWSFPPRPDTHHVRWIACHPLEPKRHTTPPTRRLRVGPSITSHGAEPLVKRWRLVIDAPRRSTGRLCGSAWSVQGFASALHESVRRALDPPGALPRSAFIGATPALSEVSDDSVDRWIWGTCPSSIRLGVGNPEHHSSVTRAVRRPALQGTTR